MRTQFRRFKAWYRVLFRSNFGALGITLFYFAEGLYVICNPDYLHAQERFGWLIGWIDDEWFGFLLIAIAAAMLLSIIRHVQSIKRPLITFSAFLFGVYSGIFILRAFDGFPNSSWALALMGLWLSIGITKYGDFDE
ncbi:hypothetical protein ACRYI5_03205 [Furfurilactobacillus sp. WILCCON 0119]